MAQTKEHNRRRGELTRQTSHEGNPHDVYDAQVADYATLDAGSRIIANVGTKPKLIIYATTGLTIILGWAWITFLTAGVSSYSAAPLGPGVENLRPWLEPLAQWIGETPVLASIMQFCIPQVASGPTITTFIATYSMWIAMAIAMMLPSAAPMFRTYGDIAEVAKSKGERTVSLNILAFGYLSSWLLFAFFATLIQLLLIQIGQVPDMSFPVGGVVGGIILLGAGIYQFSEFKNACLEKCRNPFNTLFAKWSVKPWGVFKLGVEQGFFCVGCCWALMLVMLVVGAMNLAWMAFFTLFAIVEKSGKGKVTSRVTGGILLFWGGILAISSFGF